MFASKVQIHRLQEPLCIKDKLIDTYPKLYTFINKEPNKENAKFNVITLTGKGQILAEKLGNFRNTVEDIIAKGLGKEDKKELIHSLNIACENICEYEKKRMKNK